MEEGALYSTYRYLGGILYQMIVPDREGYLNLVDVLRDGYKQGRCVRYKRGVYCTLYWNPSLNSAMKKYLGCTR